MGKCPYCQAEIHLQDFFHIKSSKKTKKGEIRVKLGDFKGQSLRDGRLKMYTCPSCEFVLGFSEYDWNPL
jgi:hypothetical protein